MAVTKCKSINTKEVIYEIVLRPNGASVPLIKINDAESGRAWNEYVVYNSEQIKLKYLLIIERNGW
jgi:hypothetical protein